MKTAELTGAALDWAVAKCEGAGAALVTTHSRGEVLLLSDHTTDCDAGDHFKPSTDWAQGGPIIEREGMQIYMVDHSFWGATMWWDDEHGASEFTQKGPTPLIAAMRCYVASRFGDEIEVPEELKEV